MIERILLGALTAILMTTAGAPAWAADCGDRAGAGGTRVACACGDNVITNTTLKAADPVVNTVCPGVGLSIGADDITLNCAGREIVGEPDEPGILLVDRTGVTVRSCKITGFLDGIRLSTSRGNTLLSNTIRSSNLFGIFLEVDCTDNLVKSNRVMATGFDGINLGPGASRNMIVANTLEDGASDGIDLDGPATFNTVKGNRITGFTDGTGIELDSDQGFVGNNVFIENVSNCAGLLATWLAAGNATGIRVRGDGNTIARNIFDNNAFDGISASGDGGTIDQNRGERNAVNGLTVSGDGNLVKRNIFNYNGEWGICVAPGNTDGGMNRGKGNGVGDVSFDC